MNHLQTSRSCYVNSYPRRSNAMRKTDWLLLGIFLLLLSLCGIVLSIGYQVPAALAGLSFCLPVGAIAVVVFGLFRGE